MKSRIEIMDSTLRDGEQTNGVSFLPHEKLMIARLLLEKVNVDRLEVASARVSEGEKEAVTGICRFAEQAGYLDRIEVLGFVDHNKSVDWIADTGCHVINLDVLDYAESKHFRVNLYLEDWSSGMINSPEYVYQMMEAMKDTNIERFLLPDTLGILTPTQCEDFITKMVDMYPDKRFDFHAHNDYDMAVADSLAAVRCGASGIHVTVNGLGERCGNAPLSSVEAVLKDMCDVETNIVESQLNMISRVVEGYSGIAVSPNEPIVGENVFTQVAGVHADGDKKDNLYSNALKPERFGRKREFALGKNSGKANIEKNLEELGMTLTPEQVRKVTQVTQDDLPYIVSDVLNRHDAMEERVKLLSYMVSTSYGLKPIASLKVEINGKVYTADATGDGQYDAFVKALRKVYRDNLNRTFPRLTNYSVTIPPGGHTDALVQTIITWQDENGRVIRTHGLDADQTEAAIKATFKMLNIFEEENTKK